MESSFKKIVQNLNVQPLVDRLKNSPSLWGEITGRQYTEGSPHRDTQSIFVRWAKEQTIAAVFNEIEAVDYPAASVLEADLQPIMKHFSILVQPEKLGRILIVNLLPGGSIAPHVDEGAYADHYERFHVSLESEPGNLFYSAHTAQHFECVHMLPGELFWFNHKREHWLHNQSKVARTHLIIDAVAPKFRVERVA